jgi:hypothetical protein
MDNCAYVQGIIARGSRPARSARLRCFARSYEVGYASCMPAARPPWLALVAPEELQRLRTMTPTQRLAHFVQACELSRALLQHRPDAREVLARRVPLSAEAEATWLRLCAEGRRARAA